VRYTSSAEELDVLEPLWNALQEHHSEVSLLSEVKPALALFEMRGDDAIEGLSVLRNLAAHGGEKDISSQRAHEFVALAQGVIYAITSNARRENP
jgi:hypothetical protein